LIDGATLTQQGSGSLANALNGTVPGLWLWHEGSGLLARFGSMRGASSFGATAPKIYVDGIELANPLLLARLTAESVEWIEVISGPQGAALYGANAMAGVLNIRTRHDAPYDDGRVVRVHSGVGLSSTAYAPAAAVTQGHGVNVAARAGGASAVLNVATSSLGNYAPDAAARDVSVDFSGRLTGGGGLMAASARFVDANGGTNALSGVRQLTAGITAALHRDARWVHTATVGIDGFTALGSDATGVVLPGDAPLPDHGALRGSVRLASTGRFGLADVVPAKLSLAVEHSVLRESAPGPRTDDAHATTSNTGLTVQGDVALHPRLLVHAGLRFDHDGGFLDPGRFATLPMLSSSWAAIATEPVGVSLRTSYGRAIRWPEPRYATLATRGRGAYVPVRLIDMRPEEQTGVEAGVDVRIGRALTLLVTHFDQTASVLAQPRSGTSRFSAAADAFARARSDVGEIDNTGWELQAGLRAGALALNGTLAFVDSRVGRVAAGYAGDLRTGDRMLEVPARTFGITASWTAADWAASLSAARASDWVGYDRAALAALAMGTGAGAINGTGGPAPAIALRDYRVTYDGFTHIGASLSGTIRPGLVLMLSGDNLLNLQRGEPDNLTVVPGRTITLGARATLNALR
jgi:iron complex outermembrane recepter protein